MDAHKNAHTHTHKSLHANSHTGEVLEIRFWTIYLTSTCVKKKKKKISLSHPITYMHRDRVEFRHGREWLNCHSAGMRLVLLYHVY